MGGISFTCAYCTAVLLDTAHARKHVATACPTAPATKLYLALKRIQPRFEPVTLESSEHLAEEFRQASGYLAPGKDVPAAMNANESYDRERRTAWNAFIDFRRDEDRRVINEAIAAAEGAADVQVAS